jgi:hypothetical protein
MWRRFIYVLVGVSSVACAATTPSTRPLKTVRREVITAAEIVAARVTDVYQAVAQLRPEFFNRTRSMEPMAPGRQGPIAVYLNETPIGGEESLRSIPLDEVRQIRFMTSTQAEFRWGRSHPRGAIVVQTAKK